VWVLTACAVTGLTACSAVVNGTGSAARGSAAVRPPSTSAASSASAPSPSATSDPRLRTVDATTYPLGDPVTAELCAGAPRSAFRTWGRPEAHWWQSAGRCYYDVSVDENDWFQVETSIIRDFNHGDATERPLASGAARYDFPMQEGDCERAFEPADGNWAIDVNTDVTGHVPDRILCAAAKRWLDWAQTAYLRGPLPRRSLARPSLTRFDLCQLVTLADIASVPGLQNINEDDYDLGGSCYGAGSRFRFDLEVVFLKNGELGPTSTVVSGRHTILTSGGPSDCEAFSAQGATRNRTGREHLTMEVRPLHGTDTTHALCRAATAALAKVLDTAGLH
jgi:hypothetical protein